MDQQSGERTFLNVKRIDLGAGLGVHYYRVLILVQDRNVLERIRRGTWFHGVGADVATGKAWQESPLDSSAP